MSSTKPKIVQQIENIFENGLVLHQAKPYPDLQTGLMAFKSNHPKYAVDNQGRLIGLNLAATRLDDNGWQKIVALLEQNAVRLQALNLSDNNLKNFSLSSVTSDLSVLDIDDNPLEYPAPEVIQQGPAAVLRFLKASLAQGIREAFEIKMLIVGEGETGKTTLWNLLQNPNYPVPCKQDSTVGIQIKEGWSFEHIDHPDKEFLINLWDFGGQEIQYMTHQFFLTRRSFYVLLADGRKEVSNFPYWLDIIDLLGRDQDKETRLPVLVILNEKGNKNATMPYDRKAVEEQYPGLEIISRAVDFARKDGRMEAVVKTIQQILCRQIDHLPLKIPVLWDNVRLELNRMRESVNHINYSQFSTICNKHGVTDTQQQSDLSRLFHDLGYLLHFQDDVNLADFVILNSGWAVKAVYQILENDNVKEFNQGRFNQRLLQDIWTEKGYSAEEKGKLLSLMLKEGFEVCFRATENQEEIFIAPQLLPDQEPDDICWDDSPETLRYVYEYPFMPKGIIGRLIVRLHEYIENSEDSRKVVWKDGMHMQKDGCRARVRFIKDRTKGREIIKIEVQGNQAEDRKHVLRDIRQELDGIHKRSFPSLRVFRKIPCNCSKCERSLEPFEHDSEVLDNMRKKGRPVQCQKSGDMVPVQQLLDGVYGEMRSEQEDKQTGEDPAINVTIHNSFSAAVPDKKKKKHWYQRWWWVSLAAIVSFIAAVVKIVTYVNS